MKITRYGVLSFFLIVGLSIFPLYLFPSGRPQISHIFFSLFIIFSFILVRFNWKLNISILFPLFLLNIIVIIRQSLYFILDEPGAYEAGIVNVISPVIYLLFNTLLFFFIINLYINYGHKVYIHIKKASIISLIIATLGVFILGYSLIDNGGSNYRNVGTFNNPNQLGYYAICIMGILTTLLLKKLISRSFYLLLSFSAIFLSILSLSKAATISIIFYYLVLLNIKNIRRNIILIVLLLVTASYIFLTVNYDDLKITSRLISIGEDADDSLMSRGYSILSNLDARLIYGWGEGFSNYSSTSSVGHEIHSTLGNILISYGLLGFIPFLYFVIKIALKTSKEYGVLSAISLFSPFMIYGLTHNGFRSSIFWVFLSILFFFSIEKRLTKT